MLHKTVLKFAVVACLSLIGMVQLQLNQTPKVAA
jgi:hypothetical protein